MNESDLSSAPCSVCDAAVAVEASARKHEIVPCPECGTEFEVTGLQPLTLAPAPAIEEDWGE